MTPRVALLCLASLLPLGCGPDDRSPDAKPPAVPLANTPGGSPAVAPAFTDITAVSGLPAEFGAMPDGTYALTEIMGPGVALLDYDGDGDLDVLERRCPPPGNASEPAPDRLWQRQADGRYVDASATSGLHDPGYGMGVAVGDVDDDGDVDVYCANYGHDTFFRNQGDGTFIDDTAAAGFGAADGWTCAVAFFDADRDGDLDLFASHYVAFQESVVCRRQDSAREYCGPLSFTPTVDTLWRNQGGGRFVDDSVGAGINARGAGLGVTCADFTGDGWPDVYVANDAGANHLWVNRGDGRFVEDGLERGAAVNRFGKPEGSMGVGIGDADGDGALDLFVTNIEEENNTLYTGDAAHGFLDVTARAGMSRHDLGATGFGCAFLDVELDGDVDLAIVNGRVRRSTVKPNAHLAPFWNPFAEPNFLFWNDGKGGFTRAEVADGGDFVARAEITRGLAIGDLDGDGDLDLATSQVLGPLRLYRNDVPRAGHWLLVRARTGKRDALGADVRVTAGGRTLRRLCLAAFSYVSSSDPRAHFGLADAARFDSIEVLWPSGRKERFEGGAADRVVELVEGEGRSP